MTMTQQLSKPQSTKQIATRLVNECLRVQPNEQVVIASWDHTLEYANALALEVEHAGGISTSTLMGNDFYWAYLKEVPEEQYTRRQKGFLSLLDQTDAMIQLGGPKDPSIYPTVAGERTGKMFEGQKAIGDKFLERIGPSRKDRVKTTKRHQPQNHRGKRYRPPTQTQEPASTRP